ncbi:MAG: BON domain-containing protein [Succinivibrionaceae bacterium]
MNKLSTLMIVSTLSLGLGTGCTALVAGSAVGAMVGTGVVATDSRTAGTMIDDETIEIKAANILTNNREISEKSKLDATSVNGKVLLTGQCKDQEYISYILDRVSKLPQVKEVINKIEIRDPVPMGTRTQDTWITTKVKTHLLFGEKINSNRFKVITENGTVYLLGLVTKSESNRAINMVKTIDGVKKIVIVFDYITDDSKVAPIFSDSSNEVEISSKPQVHDAVVEDVSNSASSDTPIYYEESSLSLEKTNDVVQSKPVEVTPVTNTDLTKPADSAEPTTDDSFIIE